MEIRELYAKYTEAGKVSTDTRQIAPGSMFFALKGEKFNANAFAAEALKKGARFAVIDEEEHRVDRRCILVPDALAALQQLARFHRDQFDIPFIALTGSNGKTTSKELLHAVLSKKFRTHATRGNLNNHIGVPLTLLAMDRSVEVAVIEMGANHVGEIAALCAIANPTHGFVTNIGKAHIGTFGGFNNIVKAKAELYDHLLSHGGKVFVNSDDELLAGLTQAFSDAVTYPRRGDFYHAELRAADPMVHFRADNGEAVETQLIGTYNFTNIAAALCVGKFFGVDPAVANQAVATYVPANMRSQVMVKGTNTIILDAYNANPSSMMAAIENMSAMKAARKVLILGDMFELEGEAEKEHRAIGAFIRAKNLDEVYLCGSLFRAALTELPQAKHFPEKPALIDDLKKNPIADATVLVKGSRGMGLEEIVPVL